MATDDHSPFAHGSAWVRADFHLHTKADKEFKYDGDENAFVGAYVDALKTAGIGFAIITNHNKFDADEFKALRKRARKEGIGLLPGVELSVNDGSNGVHTLIVFSDEWLADGHDLINQFLGTAFAGKPKAQYEHENGRSNDNLIETLKKLEKYDRDFFVVFAHVEADSGLWAELDGGRLMDLSNEPLIRKYCLGFQKVRTHDNGAKCRVKVKSWWQKYPAEVEGSDAKKLDEIGRGQKTFLKIGDLAFDAVKFALTDFSFRVAAEPPKVAHSYVNAIRFEGGLLDRIRVPFSPEMNCLIGIQGSGKSSVLESLRFALDIDFGDEAADTDYKNDLLEHVLRKRRKKPLAATRCCASLPSSTTRGSKNIRLFPPNWTKLIRRRLRCGSSPSSRAIQPDSATRWSRCSKVAPSGKRLSPNWPKNIRTSPQSIRISRTPRRTRKARPLLSPKPSARILPSC
jgi:chromosome segregation protein